jgi:hypothetical protein
LTNPHESVSSHGDEQEKPELILDSSLSSDYTTLRSMLDKFPKNSHESKGIKEEKWSEKLFSLHTVEGRTYLPIPKNYKDFDGNLLFLSILKIAEQSGYVLCTSTVELKTAVLKSEKNMFFAGYVAKSYDLNVGPRIKASNVYERGMLCAQTEAVHALIEGRKSHLKGTTHSCGKILADMEGFTQSWWSLRGAIANLFKTLPKPKTILDKDLITYLLPQSEIIGKIVKKRLPFENGGVYRQEEIIYLRVYYSQQLEELQRVHNLVKRPTADFVMKFWKVNDRLGLAYKKIENDLGGIYAARARFLFRSGSKRKNDIKWAQMSLTDKLSKMNEDEFIDHFSPKNLPGFKDLGSQGSNLDLKEYCKRRYDLRSDDLSYELQLNVVMSYHLHLDLLHVGEN